MGDFYVVVQAEENCAVSCKGSYLAYYIDCKLVVLHDVYEGLEVGVVKCPAYVMHEVE